MCVVFVCVCVKERERERERELTRMVGLAIDKPVKTPASKTHHEKVHEQVYKQQRSCYGPSHRHLSSSSELSE